MARASAWSRGERNRMHRIETTFAGRPLIMETGRMARQAHGSCLIQYGETVVLCTAVAQDKPTSLPFFPLTVEFRERTYAAGKFPGGFVKRETRPGEHEILASRLIDRPVRPMFPEGFTHETQIFATVLSADQENDADVIANLGASAALYMSKIPFETPVAAVRIGRIQGQWVLNPTFQQLEFSDLDIVVAGTADAILMVEGGCVEVSEEEIAEGLQAAHDGIKELVRIQREFCEPVRQPIMPWKPVQASHELKQAVESILGGRISEAMTVADKSERNNIISTIREEVKKALEEQF